MDGLSLRLAVWCLLMLALAAQGRAGFASSEQLYSQSHPVMGTTFTIYLYAANAEQADAAFQTAFAEVDRCEQLLSNYRDSSELSRINREASSQPVVTDPEMFAFLGISQHWSRRTGGAFDMSVGRLMRAWGFFRATPAVPAPAALAAVRPETGWQHIHLDPRSRTVRFDAPGLELDPGGIGKGYAVDRSVEELRAAGITRALVSGGSSSIYALGAPPGKAGWKIEVPDPQQHGTAVSTLSLRDTSLSTSSCAEKHFIERGHLYCHIMDPHTLMPVEGMLQTTVLSPSATDGDVLSTALFVLGPAKSEQLLQSLPRDSALVLAKPESAQTCTAIRWPAPIAGNLCDHAQRKGKH